eukprot:scaffold203050_cov27-Tisochrysis_lutea.AAC.1
MRCRGGALSSRWLFDTVVAAKRLSSNQLLWRRALAKVVRGGEYGTSSVRLKFEKSARRASSRAKNTGPGSPSPTGWPFSAMTGATQPPPNDRICLQQRVRLVSAAIHQSQGRVEGCMSALVASRSAALQRSSPLKRSKDHSCRHGLQHRPEGCLLKPALG